MDRDQETTDTHVLTKNERPNLADVIDGKYDAIAQLGYSSDDGDGDNAVDASNGFVVVSAPQRTDVGEGMCCECQDMPAFVTCLGCDNDAFCDVCWIHIHKAGSRKSHKITRLREREEFQPSSSASNSAAPDTVARKAAAVGASTTTDTTASTVEDAMDEDLDNADLLFDTKELAKTALAAYLPTKEDYYLERSRYIPLRLALHERKYLRLVEAALNVSEYTDRVDVLSHISKPKRIVHQIKELCAILSGLVVAADYRVGQELFQDKNFEDNAAYFQNIFEFARRHKIANPEKMRSTYGKLVYLLMDSQIPEVKEMLNFDCVRPLKTVYKELEAAGSLDMLQDERMVAATMEILSEPGKPRHQVQKEIKLKERAIEYLAKRYARRGVDPDVLRQCLYSIGDNHAFLRWNRDPCDKMISYLTKYFAPDRMEPGFSLGIQAGRGGARLTHDHGKQYHYVYQSLTLWREILHEMFMLWTFTESDLLDETNPYRLRDTGQGLNRLQGCPRVSRAMHAILGRAQRKLGSWVGSSVIHLGDANVPNALMFIDKYTQVSRILNPIVRCVEEIDVMTRNPGLNNYISVTFGDAEKLKKGILSDFFRHAFDGSGAEDFFSAGSCIDGRLTSAWNWASLIEKKPYFPVFLLSGFTGFDGKFE